MSLYNDERMFDMMESRRRADSDSGDEHFTMISPGIDEKVYVELFPEIGEWVDRKEFQSVTEHYVKVGKAEIDGGARRLFNPDQDQDLGVELASALTAIFLMTDEDFGTWSFLSEDDQNVLKGFCHILFENIYKLSFEDVKRFCDKDETQNGRKHWIKFGRSQVIAGTRDLSAVKRTQLRPEGRIDDWRFKRAVNLIGVARSWADLLRVCAEGAQALTRSASDNAAHSVRLPPVIPDRPTLTSSRSEADGNLQVYEEGADHILACNPKIIAFYLPQYHVIPENDEWWGKGFTEWTNVRKAVPNFVGHNQPHIPADENYYDLTDVTVQRKQAALAKEYGISGFCYYMYWFDGRRVLERPLDQLLVDPTIDHEFCICWANENWTRTWDGEEKNILLEQVHTLDSDRRFILDAMKYLRDPRYTRVKGRLLLMVYRVDLLADSNRAAAIWREEVRKAGLGELHLCAVQFYGIQDPTPWGFDAAVEFPPHGWLVPENKTDTPPTLINPEYSGYVFDYEKSVDWALRKIYPDYTWYRGVFPGWDNTARRQHTGHTFANSEPLKFERWLSEVLHQTVIMAPVEHQIVFVNAWNEWGEGAHLEPDERTGRLNLMALNSALTKTKNHEGVLSILKRLRKPTAYEGRDGDELRLLNIIRGYEKSNSVLIDHIKRSRNA